jgi:two-component system chemotaxis sensor kinase CheA
MVNLPKALYPCPGEYLARAWDATSLKRLALLSDEEFGAGLRGEPKTRQPSRMSDTEIIKEFLAESYENLDRLDRDLVMLEKEPEDREVLASVFRTIHTIKGTAGFLAFPRLEAVTHVGESLLARLRDGLMELDPDTTTALLAMVDAVREMLATIEATEHEGTKDYSALVDQLKAIQQASQAKEAAAASSTAAPVSAAAPALTPVPPAENAKEPQPLPVVAGGVLAEAKSITPEVAPVLEAPEHDEAHPDEVSAAKPEEALKSKDDSRAAPGEEATIRVRVAQLDRLMNLVGELVLARNRIQQWVAKEDDSGLIGTSQRLNLITTELQEGVMKTRMQPIGNIWSKFPRTVRDVALACNKQVLIEMEGKETELDKTIIEAIKDPLTHLVRNSVDHGIERPEERLAAGKPAEGKLSLRAFHEGGQVNIEISDDGAGLDLERVKAKALQKGLLTPDQAARMSDREITNLIFLPGFSTAAAVTNVSGRGVGMDVVKTNIEKIGGTVDVQSKRGQGTTVRMKIPLTLAIIPALIVTCADCRYAIPQVNLLELVRLEGAQARKGIEMIHGAPVYRLRGRLLPLVDLRTELGLAARLAPAAAAPTPPATPAPTALHAKVGITRADEPDVLSVNIVVLQADDRHFGLMVDEINDTEEIVVKPLSKQLKSINVYAGATIMGDGRVSLILDVLGLAQHANVVSEVRDRSLSEKDARRAGPSDESEPHQVVLLFQNRGGERMAVDLSLVARLEVFTPDSVEYAGEQLVVQYRGQIMPLVRVSDLLKSRTREPEQVTDESLQVVVYTKDGNSVGLVVHRILDIVDEAFALQHQTGRKGVLGTAVIQTRITELLDLPGLLAEAAAPLRRAASA